MDTKPVLLCLRCGKWFTPDDPYILHCPHCEDALADPDVD